MRRSSVLSPESLGLMIYESDNARIGPTVYNQHAGALKTIENWGAYAVQNIWNPYVEDEEEFSLANLMVNRGSGSGTDLQTIETGWVEEEDRYGDSYKHLFILSTRDNYNDTGCNDSSCGDFVQYSTTIAPSARFANVSTENGTQYVVELRWRRHPTTASWWLKVGTEWVGYYPHRLFNSAGLGSKGDRAWWFGEIGNEHVSGHHTATDMGSGEFPPAGFKHAAYQRTLRTFTPSCCWAEASGLAEYALDSLCYDAEKDQSSGEWKNYFYFGGEGYSGDCQ